MTLTNNVKFKTTELNGEVPEAALVEPGTIEAEAVPVTMTNIDDMPDWTYSATAEDAGTAGDLDAQPGLTYSGPGTNHFRVTVTNFDLVEHGITPPEATDTAVMALYRNSEVVAFADEGYSVQTGSAIEFNVDTVVTLDEGDVLRVGVASVGEEADADWDLAPGEISIV